MSSNKIPFKKKYIKLTLSAQEFERINAKAKAWGITPTKVVTHVVIAAFILNIHTEDPLKIVEEEITKGEDHDT